MSRSPIPHMVLALQAGLVSQELLDALTAVDDKLCSACLFAEYWDTHSDRDAWLQQHLSSQLHSLAVPLHHWCCEQSASWARGAFHIPVFCSPASCKPTAPSSFITSGVTGSKRRYAAVTSSGRHKPQSFSLPPDGPLLSKEAREQEEYQQVLGVTLNLIASLGHLPGLPQELSSSTLCSVVQISRLRKIISATAPSAGTLRAHNLSFKRFLLWGADRKLSPCECFLKATNIDVADFMGKLAYLGSSVPKSTASSLAWWVKFLDVPASFSLTASVIMAEIKTARKDHDVVVQAKPFVLVRPILFIRRWQLGSPCLPMRGFVLKIPSGCKLNHVVLRTLRFMVFAGTLNLEVLQTCLGPHCVVVYWMKTGESMRGTTFCQSVVAFNLILSFLVLQSISHPLTGVVLPRQTSKLRACGLF